MTDFFYEEQMIIIIKLLLAVLCGGILGLERERKKRPAGLRTYILVCVGAALVMMTNEYIFNRFNSGDPARMAAQVISGIGFLGAGTILVTSRNRVKGLTTAAGLWTAACIGLAIGIGYYFAAICSCILIFFAISLLHKFDYRVTQNSKLLDIYVELKEPTDIGAFMHFVKEKSIRIKDVEIFKSSNLGSASVIMTIQLLRSQKHEELIHELSLSEKVTYIEEI